MILSLEYKKIKRTGFLPAFICGGTAAAALPILNTAVRSDVYTGLDAPALSILLDANWQMTALLNVLLIAIGTCILYYTEFSNNAIQRMHTLPLMESRLFFGKYLLLVFLCVFVFCMEATGIAFSACLWFEWNSTMGMELLKNFGYSFLLTLPVIFVALLIASVCRNMWISLGIDVVCVFTATMLPTDHFVLSLFPFALPFQTLIGTAEHTIRNFISAGIAEILILAASEIIITNLRRLFA